MTKKLEAWETGDEYSDSAAYPDKPREGRPVEDDRFGGIHSLRAAEWETICRFLDFFGRGKRLHDAAKAAKTTWPAVLAGLELWPELNDRFELAKRARAEEMVFEALKIVDDDRDVIGPDGKGNAAVVNNKKLKAEVRMRAAAIFDPKRFGPSTARGGAIEVNINIGENIERARARVKQGKQKALAAEQGEEGVVL